ncbi:hypothetical protein Tco_0886537 [Tanacetum coccineum]
MNVGVRVPTARTCRKGLGITGGAQLPRSAVLQAFADVIIREEMVLYEEQRDQEPSVKKNKHASQQRLYLAALKATLRIKR